MKKLLLAIIGFSILSLTSCDGFLRGNTTSNVDTEKKVIVVPKIPVLPVSEPTKEVTPTIVVTLYVYKYRSGNNTSNSGVFTSNKIYHKGDYTKAGETIIEVLSERKELKD